MAFVVTLLLVRRGAISKEERVKGLEQGIDRHPGRQHASPSPLEALGFWRKVRFQEALPCRIVENGPLFINL